MGQHSRTVAELEESLLSDEPFAWFFDRRVTYKRSTQGLESDRGLEIGGEVTKPCRHELDESGLQMLVQAGENEQSHGYEAAPSTVSTPLPRVRRRPRQAIIAILDASPISISGSAAPKAKTAMIAPTCGKLRPCAAKTETAPSVGPTQGVHTTPRRTPTPNCPPRPPFESPPKFWSARWREEQRQARPGLEAAAVSTRSQSQQEKRPQLSASRYRRCRGKDQLYQ